MYFKGTLKGRSGVLRAQERQIAQRRAHRRFPNRCHRCYRQRFLCKCQLSTEARLYCTCGAIFDGQTHEPYEVWGHIELYKTIEFREWLETHSGDGHARCDGKIAMQARRREFFKS